MKFLDPIHWTARLLIPVAFLVLGLVAIHYIGEIQSLFGHSVDAAIAGAKVEAHTHAAFVQHEKTLADLAERRRRTAVLLRDSAAHVTTKFDSLQGLAQAVLGAARNGSRNQEAARILATASAACHDALTLCQARGDSLQAADSADKARGDANLTRALHADSLLAPLLGAADCHWIGLGFLPRCLTRTQSFAAGGLLGGVGVVAAAILLHVQF